MDLLGISENDKHSVYNSYKVQKKTQTTYKKVTDRGKLSTL